MTSSFDSIPNAITAKALANNFNMEEKSRREACVTNKKFYYGETDGYVSTFNLETEIIGLNLTKPVISKRASMLYSRKLTRDFDGDAASVAFLEAVYEENDIDSFLGNVDLMAELTGSALVSPVHSELLPTGIKLQMWDGSQISAVADEQDPNIPAAISLVKVVDQLANGWNAGSPTSKRVLSQQVWTDDAVVSYEGPILTSTQTNPFGFIPFVNFMGEEVPGQYIGFAPATLVRKLNSTINQMMTDLGYTIKMQSASPVVLSGYQSGEGIILTPGRAISLPAGAAADVLDFQPKIKEVLEVIQFIEDKIYETSSVPKISIIGGEGNSGRELLVRWFPLVQVYQEKTVRFQKYEKELANTILRVAGLAPIKDVNINYPDEEQLPLSPQDETLERDITLGLKTPVDEIVRRNPHLTEEEASVTLTENKTLNDAIEVTKIDNTIEV